MCNDDVSYRLMLLHSGVLNTGERAASAWNNMGLLFIDMFFFSLSLLSGLLFVWFACVRFLFQSCKTVFVVTAGCFYFFCCFGLIFQHLSVFHFFFF